MLGLPTLRFLPHRNPSHFMSAVVPLVSPLFESLALQYPTSYSYILVYSNANVVELSTEPRGKWLCMYLADWASCILADAWHQVQPGRGAEEHPQAPGGEGAGVGGRPLRGRPGECLARGLRCKGGTFAISLRAVICYMLYGVCSMLYVILRMLHVICYMF